MKLKKNTTVEIARGLQRERKEKKKRTTRGVVQALRAGSHDGHEAQGRGKQNEFVHGLGPWGCGEGKVLHPNGRQRCVM